MARKADMRRTIEQLAAALRGSVTPGAAFDGTVQVDDLDIEIAVRVRRSVTREQATDYKRTALELIETEGWRDHCAISVKDRSRWALSAKATKQCSKPVTTVVVTWGYDYKSPATKVLCYSFRCSCHVENHGRDGVSVLAVVELPDGALKLARSRRKAAQIERDRLERMTDEQRIAEDARMVGRKTESAEILKGAA